MKYHRFILGAVALAAMCAAFPASAQSRQESPAAFPRLESSEEVRGFVSGGYTWQELARMALWASTAGLPEAASVPRFTALLEDAAAQMEQALPEDPRQRAEYVLTYLHDRYLKAYSALQTRIDVLLTNGRFNCVSSAVFYTILANAAGLEVFGVVTRDHAFATVRINGETIDVETTNRYGFDPGNRTEFHDRFGQTTGFAYVPARNYRERAEIGLPELVSLILSNRITELEKSRRYIDAVPLAIDREAMLAYRSKIPNSAIFADPHDDVLDRLFNFGAVFVNARREEDALRWADFAAPLYPDEKRWADYVDAAVNNMLDKYIRGRDIAGARDLLTHYQDRLTPGILARLDSLVTQNEIVAIHNTFAAQYNKRDFVGAYAIAAEGLARFPGNKQLASDAALANKAQQQ
ncbi:MAG: hypothetical protein LBS64_03995 [Spirochaetaceae bacterium]|jgi:hypothetical protein|nr:hypothetical protein [Spirochaetaceae bacterium]